MRITFCSFPKEFCCSAKCVGTNNFQLVQASFDLCLPAFCRTNVKMKKVKSSKSCKADECVKEWGTNTRTLPFGLLI